MKIEEGYQCSKHGLKRIDEGDTRGIDIALQTGSQEQWQQQDEHPNIEQGEQVCGSGVDGMPVPEEQQDDQKPRTRQPQKPFA